MCLFSQFSTIKVIHPLCNPIKKWIVIHRPGITAIIHHSISIDQTKLLSVIRAHFKKILWNIDHWKSPAAEHDDCFKTIALAPPKQFIYSTLQLQLSSDIFRKFFSQWVTPSWHRDLFTFVLSILNFKAFVPVWNCEVIKVLRVCKLNFVLFLTFQNALVRATKFRVVLLCSFIAVKCIFWVLIDNISTFLVVLRIEDDLRRLLIPVLFRVPPLFKSMHKFLILIFTATTKDDSSKKYHDLQKQFWIDLLPF